MAEEIIRKADLARLLGLSKSRVTQLCRLGLPVRKDGKLDRAAALAWCDRHIGFPANGRTYGKRVTTPERVRQAINGEGIPADLPGPADSLVGSYEAFRARFARLPKVLRGIEGVPDWLRIALPELLDSTAGEVALMVDYSLGTDLIAEDGPRAQRLPEPDRGAVPAREWAVAKRNAERFLEEVDAVLYAEYEQLD
jgi:hypothetical protein